MEALGLFLSFSQWTIPAGVIPFRGSKKTTTNIMDKETFEKAQAIDDRLAHLYYLVNRAKDLREGFDIKIISRNPRGDESLVAVLEKGNEKDKALRDMIYYALIARYCEEIDKLRKEFYNL